MDKFLAFDLDLSDSEKAYDYKKGIDYQVYRDKVDQVFIFNQQVFVHVQKHVVHEHGHKRVDCSNWVGGLFLLDVVRIRAVNC